MSERKLEDYPVGTGDLPTALKQGVSDLRSAMAWIDALVEADLLFHFEDSPDTIVTGGLDDGRPTFTPAAARLMARRVARLYEQDWGEWECPIGYAMYSEAWRHHDRGEGPPSWLAWWSLGETYHETRADGRSGRCPWLVVWNDGPTAVLMSQHIPQGEDGPSFRVARRLRGVPGWQWLKLLPEDVVGGTVFQDVARALHAAVTVKTWPNRP